MGTTPAALSKDPLLNPALSGCLRTIRASCQPFRPDVPPALTSLTLCWPPPPALLGGLPPLRPIFFRVESMPTPSPWLPPPPSPPLPPPQLSLGVEDTEQSPPSLWLLTSRARLPASLPRMAHSQLKGSTSKTNPLTSSPKPVLPRLPGSITLQDSVLEPRSYPGFRPALLAIGARRQTLPMEWLPPHLLAFPATTRRGALVVSDLNDRNSLQPFPQPRPHLLESQASFNSAGFTSLLLRVGVGRQHDCASALPMPPCAVPGQAAGICLNPSTWTSLLLALAANPTCLSRPVSQATSFKKPFQIPYLGVSMSLCPQKPPLRHLA